MNKTLFSFLITFLAGISTVIGIIPCYLNEKYKEKIISFSLAFSSGVMISISLISLIPEATILLKSYFNNKLFLGVIIFVIIGIIFSSLIDKSIEKYLTKNKLYKLGIISVIVLMLHNIPEGITTFISTNKNLSLGISLALAIAFHNIPEGISIAVPIYYSTNSKKKALFYTIVAGFSEFLGAVGAYLFIEKYISNLVLSIILLITAGIMLHISIYELLPNSLEYKEKKMTISGLFIGIIVIFIVIFLL